MARPDISRALRAVRVWPDRSEWRGCAIVALAASASLLLLGLSTGLLVWELWEGNWSLLLLRVLVLPSLLEEIVFRGALTPDRRTQPRFWRAIAPGLAAFVLWHVGAAFVVPGAGMFLRPDFLLSAFLLGFACAWMRWRTGSLWPGILFHAVAVWAWLVCLGGPEPF